jgi:tripartite-type tricarboxylate transporter receptor subunit TctC
MNKGRRAFLRSAAGAIAFPALQRVARAQGYPTRFVRLVCRFPPGGSNDLYARLIGQSLSERLGQQVVVENRTGAAGSIATGSVAIAPRDGYTLLLTSSADAWNTALYDNLSFDYVHDIAPISGLAIGMAALTVNSTSPINSVPDLIAFARSNPGKVNVGSGGVGTISHVAWAIFASRTGVNTVHVPYRGEGPAMADLLAGQVQVVFPALSPALELLRGGKLRALAVTGAARSSVLPSVPTVSEFVSRYEVSGYWGVGAPRGTPTEIIERLSKEISASVNGQRLNSRITELGDVPFASPASEFAPYVAQFTERWGKTLRDAGIKAS